MNEKQKALEAALEACKAAMDVCEDVTSIQVMRSFIKGGPCTVYVMIDKLSLIHI